jgi:glycosyltransferase involved in cell wall biosynthesis
MLAMLLDSLAKQIFCQTFEIIVVDNDPVGGGAEVVAAVRQRYPDLNLHYSVEPQKGISFARNRAASLATGDFIAWIDDDETAAEQWLMSLWVTLSTSDADAVFGPVLPVCPPGSPSWSKRCGVFHRPRHVTGTVIDVREARTSNALVKASWLRSFASPFDIKLANTGGEDYDFFARIKSQGARLVWCDEAEVSEMVPFERQRVVWILERRLRGSVNYWRRHSEPPFQMAIKVSTGGVGFFIFGFAGVIAAPFGIHRAVRLWGRAMGGLGRAVAITGLRWKGY